MNRGQIGVGETADAAEESALVDVGSTKVVDLHPLLYVFIS